MFTGIVEETGTVIEARSGEKSIELVVRADLCARDAQTGDSIAVNGCCLTIVHAAPNGVLHFDLLKETWTRTNLQFVAPGSLVNLERALPADGRLHGHFVTGHIDATARIDLFEKREADWFLRIAPPPDLLRYLVMKGSIAVDGISLTVAEVDQTSFAVWIIPHTREITALRERKPGEPVNLEVDLLAKYVERLLAR